MLPLRADQLRTATLLRKNLLDAATIRELSFLVKNDLITLLNAINAVGGAIETTITVDGTVTVVYDNLFGGPFTAGETVTDSVTGATGEVVTDDAVDTLVLKNVSGEFSDGATLTGGTSGATADINGVPTYSTVDLTNTSNATVFILESANANEAIGAFTNAPTYPFTVISSGATIFEIVNGTIKTSTGQPIVLNGNNGDLATFETRSSVVKQTGVTTYA